jgi:hypothetical protein
MPYTKSPRPYKHEWEMQQQRDEKPARAARARARRTLDAKGVDRNGKDIDHVVALSKGGTNAPSNLRLTTPSKNRSFSRNKDSSMKANDSGRKRK